MNSATRGDYGVGCTGLGTPRGLGALRENYRRIARLTARTAAVVKANAYGLGAVRVAEALRLEGCLFVLSGPTDDASAAAMVRYALTPVLNDATPLSRWRAHRETWPPCMWTRECIGSASTTRP